MKVVYKESILQKMNSAIKHCAGSTQERVKIDHFLLTQDEYDKFIWWTKPVGCTDAEYIQNNQRLYGGLLYKNIPVLLDEGEK